MSKLNKPQATARPAREPFLYVTRRDQIPLGRAILIRVIAILLALIVCSVVTRVLTGDDPLSIYATILHGAFGTGRMLVTLHDIAILLCIGVLFYGIAMLILRLSGSATMAVLALPISRTKFCCKRS